MEDYNECCSYDDSERPVHTELSDDESREYGYHSEYESIHGSDFSISLVSLSLRNEDSDHRRERDHADVAHEDSRHRDHDEYPESDIPDTLPRRERQGEIYDSCEDIEGE
jgi:hypothetical protein